MPSIEQLSVELQQDKTFLNKIGHWTSHKVGWEVLGTSWIHVHCNMLSAKIKIYEIDEKDRVNDEVRIVSKENLFYCRCCHKLGPGYMAGVIDNFLHPEYE